MESNEIVNQHSTEIKEMLSAMNQVADNLEAGIIHLASTINHIDYLSNDQVCQMLHISKRTLQDYRDRGRLSFYKLEGKILYKLSDIEKLLKESYNKAWEQD